MSKLKDIRDSISKERGLVLVKKHTHKKPIPVITSPNLDHLKTPDMKYLELLHGQPIVELIAQGSLPEVAKRLGRTTACICKWRKRLGLRQ